jgi:hypothetical protein
VGEDAVRMRNFYATERDVIAGGEGVNVVPLPDTKL